LEREGLEAIVIIERMHQESLFLQHIQSTLGSGGENLVNFADSYADVR
jgi:hypothetical protein